MDGRRSIAFVGLDEIMPEVDRLLGGHVRSGRWSLGQILHHLATAIKLIADGDHPPPGPLDPEMARRFEVRRRRFFSTGRFPEGVEVPIPALEPPLDADERAEAESLRSVLRRFQEAGGPFPAHPVLGPLSKEEWAAFHRLHCAHHLGFVRPTSTRPEPGGMTFEGATS